MKKFYFLLMLFGLSTWGWGQTTITIQDFEDTPATPTWSYSATGGGTNVTTDKYNGAKSYRLASNQILTMNNVDISGYTSVVLSVAFAGDGPDSGEDLFMDISYNNGSTWVGTGSIKLVDGYSGTDININTTNASNPTTVGSNPWPTNIGVSETQIKVQFRCFNGAGATEYYYIDDVKLTGTLAGSTPPTLTADATDNNVDNNIDITFTEDAAWRGAVTAVKIGGTALTVTTDYVLSEGNLQLKPSGLNVLLTTAGSKSVTVEATGYSVASVTQQIDAGAATKLGMKTQPTAPASNGAVLATQPAVYIQDQYGNTTTSTATVIAAVGAGTWTLGGTTSVAASAGTTTYSGLTATSAAAVTGATITFTSGSLTSVTSAPFNIPVPLVNDLCDNATSLTIDAAAISGTLVGSTYNSPFSKKDVWYSVEPTCTGNHTITVTGFTGNVDVELFSNSNSCPVSTTYLAYAATSGSTETITQALTSGDTYYIRVLAYDAPAESSVFTIRITSPTPITQTVTSTAATGITETTATLNGNVTAVGVCPSTTEKGFVYSATAINSNPLVSGTGVTKTSVAGISTGAFSLAIASLASGTGYSFKSYVYDGSTYSYGAVTTFATTPLAPVATDATEISTAGFTATWEASTGAASYRLDVSEYETFATAGSNMTDLIISEYVEGSSNNKAIELYNGTGSTINLADYTLIHFNGGASRTAGTRFALTFTNPTNLANGETYVIANSSSNSAILAVADLSTVLSFMTFNGDDAIAIYPSTGVSGTTIDPSAVEIDIFGKIGEDPGSAWTSGSFSTVNKTLVRNSSVSGGVTTNPTTGFATLSTEWDQSAEDVSTNLGSHTFSGGSTPSFVSGYNDLAVNSGTSQEVTGLSPGTTYYYRVRAVGTNSTSVNSNVISVTTSGPVTWTGTAWSNVTGPTTTIDAVIDGNFTTSTDLPFTAQSLTINAGKTLTISPTHTITVQNAITNNGTITIEHQGSLVQINETDANTGSGLFRVHKTTGTYKNYDYFYWSSPVENETVGTVLPTVNYKYKFNPANYLDVKSGHGYPQPTASIPGDGYDDNGDDWSYLSNATIMPKGIGFIAMGEDSPTNFNVGQMGVSQAAFNVTFEGEKIHNGTFTAQVYQDAYTPSFNANNNNLNLLGNPFPSAIDVYELYHDNASVLEGKFYFWTHDAQLAAISGPNTYDFNNNNFAIGAVTGTYPSYTYTQTLSGTGKSAPRYIASTQGFMASALDGIASPSTVTYKNSMRTTGNNNTFLRQASDLPQVSRLWLNMTGASSFNQIAVGFDTSTSDAYGMGDAPRVASAADTDFYSIIPEVTGAFAIQFLSDFQIDKLVPLGISVIHQGAFEITLDHVEGVFNEGQIIYLEDTYLDIIHNLSEGAYPFTQTAGANINDRFILRFTNTALGNDDTALNTVKVYPNPSTGVFNVTYQGSATLHYTVYDLTGKTILSGTGNQIDLSRQAIGMYFAKITDGSAVRSLKLVRE